MFRGGDYIDKPDFADPPRKGQYYSLDVSDISGARPNRQFISRHSQKAMQAGAQIIDNNRMMAAGGKKPTKEG